MNSRRSEKLCLCVNESRAQLTSMRIKLSSRVTGSDVDFGEIASASNLYVVRGLETVNSGQILPLCAKLPLTNGRL